MRDIVTGLPRAQVDPSSPATRAMAPRTVAPPAEQQLLYEFFERQADARPDRIAVEVETQCATYGALERYSNRIARRLRKRGVRAGSRVALLMPRTIDAYASMLGIMKAGGAYVPLDPEWPADRVAYVLDNSHSQALVTTSSLAEYHAAFGGAVLRMDVDRESIAEESGSRFTREESGARAAGLCYIIYTSGSTGRPKGVMVEHRQACHLVSVERDVFRVRSRDRVLQSASLSFDLSIEEIWLAFRAGATLVTATPAMLRSGPDLARILTDAHVTVMSCVPTLVSMMADDVPSVRLLILGGERCPAVIVERWSRFGRRIVNTYGPTETTVTATYADLERGAAVTIGRPLPGYAVYVLDEQLRPVEKGQEGEICIAGAGVARGYVGMPDATRERFVHDPFAHGTRAKMYRSGDLGRTNANGDIEFIGRRDGQIKLRGHRIELGEIESALARSDGVLTAACAVKPDASGDDQLVGYVVARADGSVDEEQVRRDLRRHVPPYMVPSVVLVVDDLPTLASGKLDRAALPSPASRESTPARTSRPPETPLEHRVARVWETLFQSASIGVDDHFFLDLGGHSLLAARFVSELRKDPQFAHVSMVDVYNYPTVSAFAASLAQRFGEASPRAPSVDAETPDYGIAPVVDKAFGRRHKIAGAVQGVALYMALAFRAAQWITPYFVFFALLALEHSLVTAAAWGALTAMLVFPSLVLLALAAKWLVLGRVRSGRYPLWGAYYLRWWFVRTLMSALRLEYLSGTPLLPFVYRLFGARIGKDVHMATEHLAAFDLITIGDDSCIDDDVTMSGATVEDGHLLLGPITVGRRCFVGTRSVLRENVVVEDDARLEDLSLVRPGTRVPCGATWAGSPASPVARPHLTAEPKPVYGPVRRAATIGLYGALALAIPVAMLASVVPGIALLMQLDPLGRPLLFLAATPVVGASFVVMLTIQVVGLKWMLVGRVRAGRYPVHGSFYIRNWVVEQMIALSLDTTGPLRATLYAPPWFRALGARVGKGVELSTAAAATPDLVTIDDGGTIADEVSLGAGRIERGWLTIAPTRIGRRAFAGNSAVIPAGASLGDGALVGVLSLAPTAPELSNIRDAAWLGSPPLRLPRRQLSAAVPDARTYTPPRALWYLRALVELFRITLPPAGFIATSATVITVTFILWEQVGLAVSLAVVPAAYAACALIILAALVLVKWALDGRFHRFVRPLWSPFVWRLEFVNALYEFLASPLILDPLQGTPFLPWYLRLLGARIGQRVFLETTGFLEFDLVEIGDEAALNKDCVVQTHLFEDRVLKGSKVTIGSRCVVGATSVVLYDAVMRPGARLDALSMVMKGETLPAYTAWAGVPAERVDECGGARVAVTQAGAVQRRDLHDTADPAA